MNPPESPNGAGGKSSLSRVQDPKTPPPGGSRSRAIPFHLTGNNVFYEAVGGIRMRDHLTMAHRAIPPSSTSADPPSSSTSQDSVPSLAPSSVSASLLNSISITTMAAISSNNLMGTPRRKASHHDFGKDRSVKGHGKAIMSTMSRVIPEFSDKWVRDMLEKNNSKKAVQLWLLSGTTLFDRSTQRWTFISKTPGLERNLYEPFVDILTAILSRYTRPVANIERKVIDMHATQMKHREGHHTSPDIVVRGKGPSFETPAEAGCDVGYGNTVTFFEVKLDAVDKPAHIEQTAVYSRQIFIHQPNRWFVRALIVSQHEALLVHWDRAGVQKSHSYDIHKDAAVFVRLVSNLSNTENEEENIGLDKSIQWSHDKVTGRKVAGTMTDVCEDSNKVFDLSHPEPWSSDDQIHGSATVWWSVIDPDPKVPELKKLLVKDSWSSPGRTEEWKLLQRAADKNIRGVCKLIHHKDRRAQISNFRDGDMFFDGVFSRLVTKEYGGKLEGFTTGVQVIAALRDAVAAHGNLYGIGILHRNISHKSILLGRQGASIGEQGILINLGDAFDFYRDADSEINKQPTMGPRFYQSSMILSFLTGSDDDKDVPFAPAHDYLDDIESFFGVLCHTLLGFYPNGLKRPIGDKGHNYVKGWDAVCPRISLGAKNLLITPSLRERELAMDHIAETWGPACETLFDEFSKWLFGIHMRKAELVRGYKKTIRKLLKKSSAPTNYSSAEGSNLKVEGSNVEGSKVGGCNVEGSSVGRPDVEGSNVEWPNVERSTLETPNIEAPSASGSSVEGFSIQGSSASGSTAKEPVVQENQEEYHKSVFAPLYSDAESHYQRIVKILHEAVAALEACPTKPPPPVSIPNPTFDKKADKGKGVKRQLSFNEDEDTQSNKVNKTSEGCERTRRISTLTSAPRPQVQGAVASDTSMDTTA